MKYFAGIDLGTSSVKTVISDSYGNIISSSSVNYDIVIPFQGFAEQSPELWWESAISTFNNSLNKCNLNTSDIKAIGLSGQMHGLVYLDKSLNLLGNAILHCDSRSLREIEDIKDIIGRENLSDTFFNPVFSGSQLASLLWLKHNTPEIYSKIAYIMSPKDFIRFRLTGKLGSEYTDASATLLFDIENRCWSKKIISAFELNPDMLLPVKDSYEIAGEYMGIPVVYGAADQPAQAIGNGVVQAGQIISTIGTSGQIFTCTETPYQNTNLNTHIFCHAPQNMWYSMGAMLSAGLSLKWLKNNILTSHSYADLDELAGKVTPSANNPIFHPYLCGERSPHMNPNAKAAFFGITLEHDKGHIARAVMEGVVFGLRDCLSAISASAPDVLSKDTKIIASGGGAQSQFWLQLQADILGYEVITSKTNEQACLGAAIMAMTGLSEYKSLSQACGAICKSGEKHALPNRENVKIYNEAYEKYKQLYRG